jgi:HD domain-containing protein
LRTSEPGYSERMVARHKSRAARQPVVENPGDADLPDGLPKPDRAWFLRPDGTDGSLGIHGIGHIQRVLVHAVELAEELALPPWAREAAMLAALWHDIGRTDDRIDYYHGAKSAGKVVGLGLHHEVEQLVLETALYAVTHHSGSEEHGLLAAEKLPVPAVALDVFKVLKDADGLDRVRFDGLDVRYLRLSPSRKRTPRAKALLGLIP